MDQDSLFLKFVVVGNGDVGKSCILITYQTGEFPGDYIPTVFDNYTSQMEVDGQMITLCLWDTAGQEAYDKLRLLSYDNTDVFLVVFDVTEPNTFTAAIETWIPELSKGNLAKTPKVLIGNKIDLRSMDHHIQKETGEEMAHRLECQYFECSAFTKVGLKQLFEEATRLGIQGKLKSKNSLQNQQLQKKQQVQQEQRRCSNCQLI